MDLQWTFSQGNATVSLIWESPGKATASIIFSQYTVSSPQRTQFSCRVKRKWRLLCGFLCMSIKVLLITYKPLLLPSPSNIPVRLKCVNTYANLKASWNSLLLTLSPVHDDEKLIQISVIWGFFSFALYSLSLGVDIGDLVSHRMTQLGKISTLSPPQQRVHWFWLWFGFVSSFFPPNTVLLGNGRDTGWESLITHILCP